MKGLLLSLRVKYLNRWTFGKVTSKTVHFLLLLTVCWPGAQSARDNHALACNFAKYSPILNFFSQALSNKSFLIWLLTTPPHSTCVATLPCILSLLACFAYINLPVMNFFNRLRFDRIMVTSLWPRFWPTLYSGLDGLETYLHCTMRHSAIQRRALRYCAFFTARRTCCQ